MAHGAQIGQWVTINYFKWPNRPHYSYRMRVLGEDSHGVWGSCDAGEMVHKAGAPAFVRERTMLCLVPGSGCWSALWFPPEEETFEVYVDINTEPVWEAGAVGMVDLDLDVVRNRDGSVIRLDEDEFDANRVAFGYPDELVELARTAMESVVGAVAAPDDPFAAGWRRWYDECFRASEPKKPRIRRATASDAAAVADVYVRARHAAVPDIPPLHGSDDNVRAWLVGVVTDGGEVWVAAAGGSRVVGMMLLDGDWVEQLYVDPSRVGQGIGAQLLAVAKRTRPDGLQL